MKKKYIIYIIVVVLCVLFSEHIWGFIQGFYDGLSD